MSGKERQLPAGRWTNKTGERQGVTAIIRLEPDPESDGTPTISETKRVEMDVPPGSRVYLDSVVSEGLRDPSAGDDRRTVEIDGEEWIAVRYTDGRYLLFQEDWSDDVGAVVPGELSRCGYCLAENRVADDHPGKLVCDECGAVEMVTHGSRIPTGEIRSLRTGNDQEGADGAP